MRIEEFQDLAKRLTERSVKFPQLFKVQTLLLSLLGYLFIWSILALIVSGLVLTVMYLSKSYHLAVQITIGLTIAGYFIAGAIWIRFSPPEGMLLDREAHGELWRVIDEVASEIHGPRVDKILLTEEFNLSIVQHPRLGILGWTENYLLLGMPYMLALTPEQFRGVIAHELGHLSAAHGKINGWIYRVRLTWHRLLHELEVESNWTIIIFQPFFNWYIPYFDAFSLVLRRSNEYEADKVAAEAVGITQYGNLLVSGRLKARWLNEEFWAGIYELAEVDPNPPSDVYARMAEGLKTPLNKEQAELWLQEELEFVTQVEDSHPELADRLAAINCVPALPEPSNFSAAECYFGEKLVAILSLLSKEWRHGQEDFWANRYEDVQASKANHVYLKNKRASGEELSAEETLDLGYLIEQEEQNSSEAFLFYEQAVENFPDLSVLWFRMGCIKLDHGEEQGIEYVEKAIELDADFIIPGCSVVAHFLVERGREEAAEKYNQQVQARVACIQEKQEDFDYGSPTDPWIPHGLTDEEVKMILLQLEIYPEITRVYLARKQYKNCEDTVLLLGLKIETYEDDPWEKRWQRALGKGAEVEIERDIVQHVADQVVCPGECVVLRLDFWRRKVFKKFKAVPNSRIK